MMRCALVFTCLFNSLKAAQLKMNGGGSSIQMNNAVLSASCDTSVGVVMLDPISITATADIQPGAVSAVLAGAATSCANAMPSTPCGGSTDIKYPPFFFCEWSSGTAAATADTTFGPLHANRTEDAGMAGRWQVSVECPFLSTLTAQSLAGSWGPAKFKLVIRHHFAGVLPFMGYNASGDEVSVMLPAPPPPPPSSPPLAPPPPAAPPVPPQWDCSDAYHKMDVRKSGVTYLSDETSGPYHAYCDLGSGHAWTLAMKVKADSTLHYKHSAWTTTALLDGDDGGDATTKKNAKYPAFNLIKGITALKVVNLDSGEHTVLSLMNNAGKHTLLELMQRSSTTALSPISGKTTPLNLAAGLTQGSTCGNAWNINGQSNEDKMYQRIGGTFTYTWGCNYGKDTNGNSMGAEGAGFGLLDEQWGPFNHAKKGFGVRQAHDYTALSGGSGQDYVNGAIYVA